jgi:hypothetical protein
VPPCRAVVREDDVGEKRHADDDAEQREPQHGGGAPCQADEQAVLRCREGRARTDDVEGGHGSAELDARVEQGVDEVDRDVDEDTTTDEQKRMPSRRLRSRWKSDSKASRPRPGQENTVSTRTAPPSTEPSCTPSVVTMGRSALRSTWRRAIRCGRTPLARAVRTKSCP